MALLNRPLATAKTLGKVIESVGMDTRSGRLLEQERMETALKGLVTDGELSSIALVNAAGEPVVAAGAPIDFELIRKMQTGEHWDLKSLTVVRRVDLEDSKKQESETSRPPIVMPPRRESSGQPRDRTRPTDSSSPASQSGRREGVASADPSNNPGIVPTAASNGVTSSASQSDRTPSQSSGEGRTRGRRPPFFWMMSEDERKSIAEKRGLHGLVIALSTESFRQACTQDLWLRGIIGAFAAVSVIGLGIAWRNLETSSDLQMRLVRASHLNSHLREMNVAAAGLAHETRNPLNIIRGLAQMIARDSGTPPEVRQKTSDITTEVDRVTAQLNEFINYSRPREIRRAPVALSAVVGDVARALQSDIEDKAIRLSRVEENLTVEADEQFLRQVLFNLLINAIQAVDAKGEIQVMAKKSSPTEAILELRDNGPGVPPDQCEEIFKPYFTTHQKGTGLGLAVVQQIVLAHGWEIDCLPNDVRGAVFRISRIQLA
jgi:signal transduction histidine kinase